ncbi:TPA: hypothetical protein ACOEP6_002760 [Enterobacter ludwigii]|uniref:hypothetical protein n=1 Tax=Enterobacter sp. PTB TaxID=3143437 RepID=UPI003B5D07D3
MNQDKDNKQYASGFNMEVLFEATMSSIKEAAKENDRINKLEKQVQELTDKLHSYSTVSIKSDHFKIESGAVSITDSYITEGSITNKKPYPKLTNKPFSSEVIGIECSFPVIDCRYQPVDKHGNKASFLDAFEFKKIDTLRCKLTASSHYCSINVIYEEDYDESSTMKAVELRAMDYLAKVLSGLGVTVSSEVSKSFCAATMECP